MFLSIKIPTFNNTVAFMSYQPEVHSPQIGEIKCNITELITSIVNVLKILASTLSFRTQLFKSTIAKQINHS